MSTTTGKPYGFDFVARIVDKRGHQKYGYTEMVITEEKGLWYKAGGVDWCFWKIATEKDILESKKCFRTMVEAETFIGLLMIAA